MIPYNTDKIQDYDTRKSLEHIFFEGLGRIIELDAAPTADVPLLDNMEIGKYGNDLYVRVENTILVFSSDSQITIT